MVFILFYFCLLYKALIVWGAGPGFKDFSTPMDPKKEIRRLVTKDDGKGCAYAKGFNLMYIYNKDDQKDSKPHYFTQKLNHTLSTIKNIKFKAPLSLLFKADYSLRLCELSIQFSSCIHDSHCQDFVFSCKDNQFHARMADHLYQKLLFVGKKQQYDDHWSASIDLKKLLGSKGCSGQRSRFLECIQTVFGENTFDFICAVREDDVDKVHALLNDYKLHIVSTESITVRNAHDKETKNSPPWLQSSERFSDDDCRLWIASTLDGNFNILENGPKNDPFICTRSLTPPSLGSTVQILKLDVLAGTLLPTGCIIDTVDDVLEAFKDDGVSLLVGAVIVCDSVQGRQAIIISNQKDSKASIKII